MFVFQTGERGQHFNQSKLVISGHYSSFLVRLYANSHFVTISDSLIMYRLVYKTSQTGPQWQI